MTDTSHKNRPARPGASGAGGFLATTPGVLVASLACCLLWGSAFPCIKIGYALFGIDAADTASQLLVAGIRFTLAGLLVVAGMSVARRRPFVPSRADWPAVGLLACFQTVGQYFFFYIGLSRATGVTSSIIEATATFLAILFAALLFRAERLTARKVAGCAVGFAGVVLINVAGSGAQGGLTFTLGGEGMVLVSTVSAALSTCLISRLGERHDPVLLSGWQFVAGGAALTAMGLAGGGRLAPADPIPAVGILLYLAFVSAFAYSVWSRLLAVNPVSRVSVFGFMNPVFGVVLSALLLGEGSVIDPLVAAAALALVSAGIVTVNRAPKDAGAAGAVEPGCEQA